MYPISRTTIQARIQLWNSEASVHFCQLAKRGSEFINITYPTGLRMVRAQIGNEKAEVNLSVAKQLRAAGYWIVS